MLKSKLLGRISGDTALELKPAFMECCGAGDNDLKIQKPYIRFYSEGNEVLLTLGTRSNRGKSRLFVHFSDVRNSNSDITCSVRSPDGFTCSTQVGEKPTQLFEGGSEDGHWIETNEGISLNFDGRGFAKTVSSEEIAKYRKRAKELLYSIRLQLV